MKILVKNDYYYLEFDSGRIANFTGVLGINVCSRYEEPHSVHSVTESNSIDCDENYNDLPFTPAERRDLADFMIEHWQQFAEEKNL